MNLVIACDHAGYDLKENVKKYLSEPEFGKVQRATWNVESEKKNAAKVRP